MDRVVSDDGQYISLSMSHTLCLDPQRICVETVLLTLIQQYQRQYIYVTGSSQSCHSPYLILPLSRPNEPVESSQ